MSDSSRALDRVVSRHMRRWWLRVGVWWLLALLPVLLLASLNTNIVFSLLRQSPLLFHYMRFEMLLAHPLYLIAEFWLPALWLAAAWQALQRCSALFEDAAAPHLPVAGGSLYWLAFRQGWPLLPVAAAAAVYSSLCQRVLNNGPFSFGPQVAGEHWTLQNQLNWGFSGLTADLVLCAVSVGLLEATGKLRYSLFMLAAAKAPAWFGFVEHYLSRPPGMRDSLVDTHLASFGAWLGLALLLIMLAGLASRQRAVFGGGYALLMLAAICQGLARVTFPQPAPTLPAALEFPLWLLASAGTRLFLTGPVYFDPERVQQVYTGVHALIIYPLLEARLTIAAPWLALAAALLVDALWLGLLVMLHISLLQRCRLRLLAA